jgi:hypothetical protein
VDDKLDLYITEAGLVAGLSRAFFQGRPEAYTESILFSDYRRVGDQILPFAIEVFLEGKLVQAFRVEQYQFNVPAEPNLFLPKRAQ